MSSRVRRLPALLLVSAPLLAAARPAAAGDGLAGTLAALDTALLDSFNRCADPAQLERHAAFFDERVEFYHDTGGVTTDRAAMLANTARHACGRYTRQLVAGSLEVHPLAGYGAISQGRHRFCAPDGSHCGGEAVFVMVWQQQPAGWRVTRVLSYGHRALAQGP